MSKEDRLYKLKNGTETAVWAHDEIISQDKRIAELENRNDKLLSKYGDNWFDGFKAAWDLRYRGLDEWFEKDILEASERAEDEFKIKQLKGGDV